ncbi:D-glycero-alpha-D-manno-heptose-1,7-bisphosphate 7-phosphatase [Candidatus Solirubrobacter pratensis]|uniref:D-glycero-alpha-D-manno-heptose-1,7-bisphosphate 7-phosphatase n=1 Tax=Candidatus Solirubrobacter pratensis TaxID=1298857 RepID=UPI0004819E5E|nr:HAD family hydrolase [Candidatus Solirubrobacter pratensis]
MSRPAVFLDRDGVLNEAPLVAGRPHPPATPDAIALLPGVAEACSELRAAGLPLIVVTNQPDIARGTQSRAAVDAINARLRELVDVDEVVVCPHDDDDACACRKPRPGMLLDAARRWDVGLGRSVMVGDRWRDIEAGRAAGTKTVFLDRSYDEPAPDAADLTVTELKESVTWIIETIAPRT